MGWTCRRGGGVCWWEVQREGDRVVSYVKISTFRMPVAWAKGQ